MYIKYINVAKFLRTSTQSTDQNWGFGLAYFIWFE